MAVIRGCRGKVKVAATGTAVLIGELTNWSFEETAEQIDASEMGNCTKKFEAGAVQTSGELTFHMDLGASSNQDEFAVGGNPTIEIYPEGDGSGANYYATATNGSTITSISRDGGGVDGLNELTVGFTVNGAMTATSLP